MTAPTLLFYICLFVGAQVLLGLALALLRRRAVPALGEAQAFPRKAEQPSAGWPGTRAFRVVRRMHEDVAQTQCSFYLEPVDGQALPDFKLGQFLTFSLLLPGEPGMPARTVTRCYSLSDSPAPDHYRVTIKRVVAQQSPARLPAGVASNFFHDHVHAGDTLQIRAPSGRFHLDTGVFTPLVLIAGGIGITPMVSMVRWCAQHQPQREVHLYYGVRNSAEHGFRVALEESARKMPEMRLHVAYSRPLPDDRHGLDYQHEGHVDLALLKNDLHHCRYQFYVCGPAAMLERLVPALIEWGAASADVHFEAFGPASVPVPATAQDAMASAPGVSLAIQFRRSGRTLQWAGEHTNLLDFAQAHGIAVESGCRSGSCGSCLTPIASGTVVYERVPDADLLPGQCLLCVGKPRSPLVLEA